MKDTLYQGYDEAELQRQSEVTQASMQRIRQQDMRRERNGYAVIASIMSLHSNDEEEPSGFLRLANVAKNLCLISIVALPLALVISLRF
ncbi:MAG: hypothetical protein AAGF79_07335 [Pseudomonadota bacterium]